MPRDTESPQAQVADEACARSAWLLQQAEREIEQIRRALERSQNLSRRASVPRGTDEGRIDAPERSDPFPP